MLVGRVDELRSGKLYGWAFNSQHSSEHLNIRVMLGTQPVASGVADVMRPDLPDAGIGEGDHAFEIVMPPNIASFHGLSIIAVSIKDGEIALPIASNDERHLDDLFAVFSQRYEDALIALREDTNTLKTSLMERNANPAVAAAYLPAKLEERLATLEQRMDSAEIFFIRIDEMIHRLVDDLKKKPHSRFFNIFGRKS